MEYNINNILIVKRNKKKEKMFYSARYSPADVQSGSLSATVRTGAALPA